MLCLALHKTERFSPFPRPALLFRGGGGGVPKVRFLQICKRPSSACDDTIVEDTFDSESFAHEVFLGISNEASNDKSASVKKIIQQLSVLLAYNVVQTFPDDQLTYIRNDAIYRNASSKIGSLFKFLDKLLNENITDASFESTIVSLD